MTNRTKSILALAFEAGVHPFDTVPVGLSIRQLGDHASKMLTGRNPYFDKEYRDRFGTHVHNIGVSSARLIMGCVESAKPAGMDVRVFRAVCFRCDGEVMYQTPDDRLMGQHEAYVDMTYRLSTANEADVLKALCRTLIRRSERTLKAASDVLESLNERSPPPVPA